MDNDLLLEIQKQAFKDAMMHREKLMDSKDNLDDLFPLNNCFYYEGMDDRRRNKKEEFDYNVWE